MGNRFENPMNYVEWSKSVELARTLTPNSSLRHGRRMEEKIFEQKLRKVTKGRERSKLANFFMLIASTPGLKLVGLEDSTAPYESRRWLGWNLALLKTRREWVKLANFKSATMPMKIGTWPTFFRMLWWASKTRPHPTKAEDGWGGTSPC